MTLKMRVKVGKEMMDIEISDAGELSFPGQEEQLDTRSPIWPWAEPRLRH